MSVVRTRSRMIAGDLADQVVAGLVAERVVDQLEAVDVDDHHRALAAVAGAEGDELVEFGAEAAPVEEAGQGVVVGEVAQLGLGPLGAFQRRQHDLAVLGSSLSSTALIAGSLWPGSRSFVHRLKVDAREPGGHAQSSHSWTNAFDFSLTHRRRIVSQPDPGVGWLDGQSPGAGDQSVPAPAQGQPGRLVPLGTRRRWGWPRELDRPILLSVGYSACHWCHVMERESFEDAGDRRLHERALRQRQGRPRGAARHRRPLHGGGAGDQRPGRLADDRLLRPGRGPLLRRHLLPARRQPRDAELPDGDGSGDRRLREPARRAAGAGAAHPGAAGRDRRDRASSRAPRRGDPRTRARAACANAPTATRGGFGGAPKFPPPRRSSCCWREARPATSS